MPPDGDLQSIGAVLRATGLHERLARLQAAGGDPVADPDPQPDAAEPETTCSRCRDVGWLRANHPTGHPLVGQTVECPCGLVADRRRRQTREQAGVPSAMAEYTLDSFVATSADRAIVARLRCWQAASRDLLLIGSVGVGKTGLALALLLDALREGRGGRYVVAPTLLARLRATYRADGADDELAVLEALCSAPLLVIDDLGKVALSDWGQEKLFTLANERHLRGVRTIWTSNLDVDGLAAYLWPATWDRIRAVADVIRLTGESRRGRVS